LPKVVTAFRSRQLPDVWWGGLGVVAAAESPIFQPDAASNWSAVLGNVFVSVGHINEPVRTLAGLMPDPAVLWPYGCDHITSMNGMQSESQAQLVENNHDFGLEIAPWLELR
jgi:hypothetical protein